MILLISDIHTHSIFIYVDHISNDMCVSCKSETDHVSHSQMRDYSKNPYPLKNHIIPNEATVGAQEPQCCRLIGPGVLMPAGLGIMQFLDAYRFLLLFHDPWE